MSNPKNKEIIVTQMSQPNTARFHNIKHEGGEAHTQRRNSMDDVCVLARPKGVYASSSREG